MKNLNLSYHEKRIQLPTLVRISSSIVDAPNIILRQQYGDNQDYFIYSAKCGKCSSSNTGCCRSGSSRIVKPSYLPKPIEKNDSSN